MKISIVIPTHNPRISVLEQVISAIQNQTLSSDNWELIVVDNSSTAPLLQSVGSNILSTVQLVQEQKLGLTYARLAGVRAAQHELILFVDDDNLLQEDFLQVASDFMRQHPAVAIAGGKISGRFEVEPPKWCEEFYSNLAIRDLGRDTIIEAPKYDAHFRLLYPPTAPVGAGMVVRKTTALAYLAHATDGVPSIADRSGTSLSSAGDNQLVLTTLLNGDSVAYVPELHLEHLIPGARLHARYLSKLRFSIGRSWVQLLYMYAASPWPPLAIWFFPVALIRSFFKESAWKGRKAFVRWCYFAGHLRGRADYSKYSVSHQWLNKLSAGKILYWLYQHPKNYLRRYIKDRAVIQAEKAMKASVHKLTLPKLNSSEKFPVFFLSGAQFWEQTCYCFASLQKQSSLPLRPIIIDDGTLRRRHIEAITTIIGDSVIIANWEVEARLDRYLPKDKFPSLRARRLEYPQLKKLTDVHAGLCGWKLVLDSDMLFLETPTELLDWLKNPINPCHMVDAETSYGYSKKLMESLCGHSVPEKVNVGITGLQSQTIDWLALERWSQAMIEAEGTHYFQEQALAAMIMASHQCTVLPKERYICKPTSQQVQQRQGTLHHYVAESKHDYLTLAWRQVAE